MMGAYSKSSLALVMTSALVWSCGGGSSPTQPTATPTPVSTATPTPVPAPTPTATPTPPTDPRDNLAPGPIVKYFIKLHSVRRPDGTELEEPFPQDSDGRYRVLIGDFIVFDSTQKNEQNEECQWINDPEWKVDDPQKAMARRGSSNPFLLRVDIIRNGVFTVTASVDGVQAPQVLVVKATAP